MQEIMQQYPEVKNKRRRTMLVLGATGIVAFILGKIFGDSLSSLMGGSEITGATEFKNFRITETNDEMTLADKNGEPIFVIDKASFR